MVPILSAALLSGLYICEKDRNICDQEVTVYSAASSHEVERLKVEYVGFCGSMGPYHYSCQGRECGDRNVKFTLKSKTRFHWKNLGYPYDCEFKRVTRP